jgi:hypothetical protein
MARSGPADEAEAPSDYGEAEKVVRSLANIVGFLGVLGFIVNLVAAGWAFTSKGGEAAGVVLLTSAVVSLLSVLAIEAVRHTVMVLVDLARNVRAVRHGLDCRGREQ